MMAANYHSLDATLVKAGITQYTFRIHVRHAVERHEIPRDQFRGNKKINSGISRVRFKLVVIDKYLVATDRIDQVFVLEILRQVFLKSLTHLRCAEVSRGYPVVGQFLCHVALTV